MIMDKYAIDDISNVVGKQKAQKLPQIIAAVGGMKHNFIY